MDKDYKTQIMEQYNIALKHLNKLSPAPQIDERVGDYAGCMRAIMELKRLALNEPILRANINKPIK